MGEIKVFSLGGIESTSTNHTREELELFFKDLEGNVRAGWVTLKSKDGAVRLNTKNIISIKITW